MTTTPEDYDDYDDGQKVRYHACGKVLEFTPFIRGRLNGLAAHAVERGAPVSEAYGLVDGSEPAS